MERIALEIVALGCGTDETVIEMRVVRDQDGAFAAGSFHLGADVLEHVLEDFMFRMRNAQRVMRIDASELERRLFQVGARERDYPVEMGIFGHQLAVLVEIDRDGGDFQDGICLRIEAATLDINDYRQETAEAEGQW